MKRLIKDKKLSTTGFLFQNGFDTVASTTAEKKKCMIDLHRKRFLDDRTQSIDGLADGVKFFL